MLTIVEVSPNYKRATSCTSDLRSNQVTEGRRLPPYEVRDQQPRGVIIYPVGFRRQFPARFGPRSVTAGASNGCVLG